MQEHTEPIDKPETNSENRVLLSDSNDSHAVPENHQLNVIEGIPIPLEEMAGEVGGIQARLSAGVSGTVKAARNQEIFRENCIVSDDSNTEREEAEEEEIKRNPYEEMAEEIRGMNATLDRMQARLSVDAFEEIAKLTSNLEEEMGLGPEDTRWMILYGSKDPAIRALQVNSRRIRCQLADLERCSELGATRLAAMTRKTIRHSKHLMAYRKQYESVQSFHLAHQLEAGKCLMRYRHAQEVYCSWRELYQMGRKANEAYNKILEVTQSRSPFLMVKKQAQADIAEAHAECISTSSNLAARVEEMGRTLGIPSCRTSKAEPHQWKNYTGPPVVVKTTHWQGQYTRTVRFARGELLTIPVVVPRISETWYGRMQAGLLRDKERKMIRDSSTKKNDESL